MYIPGTRDTRYEWKPKTKSFSRFFRQPSVRRGASCAALIFYLRNFDICEVRSVFSLSSVSNDDEDWKGSQIGGSRGERGRRKFENRCVGSPHSSWTTTIFLSTLRCLLFIYYIISHPTNMTPMLMSEPRDESPSSFTKVSVCVSPGFVNHSHMHFRLVHCGRRTKISGDYFF